MASLKDIQRKLIIIRKIRAHNGLPMKELRKKVIEELQLHGHTDIPSSLRTFQRDITELTALGIPISNVRSRGYYFPEDETASPENMEAVLESFDLLNALNADTGMTHFVYPARRPARGREFLYPLLKATQGYHPVSIRYQSYKEQKPSDKKIYPYALKEWRGRWYLLGFQEGEETFKSFGLDRIQHMEKLPEKFTPRTINIPQLYQDCFGIYNDYAQPAEEVILSFNKQEGEYVKSQPIHRSQEILPDPTQRDRTVIRLKIKITKELQLELLARGFSLQIHKPESLRQEILKIHREAIKINAKEMQID